MFHDCCFASPAVCRVHRTQNGKVIRGRSSPPRMQSSRDHKMHKVANLRTGIKTFVPWLGLATMPALVAPRPTGSSRGCFAPCTHPPAARRARTASFTARASGGLQTCLKEWAPVVQAIGEGSQTVRWWLVGRAWRPTIPHACASHRQHHRPPRASAHALNPTHRLPATHFHR